MAKYLPADALIQAINKEFGANTLVRACDAIGLIKPRISTGSLSLDLMLGGGYPEGAVTLLEGESGCVAPDTVIYDPVDGTALPIAERVGHPCHVLTTNGISRASAPFWKGVGSMYRLTFSNGHVVEAAHHHLLWSKNEWRKVSEIKEGDGVLLASDSMLRLLDECGAFQQERCEVCYHQSRSVSQQSSELSGQQTPTHGSCASFWTRQGLAFRNSSDSPYATEHVAAGILVKKEYLGESDYYDIQVENGEHYYAAGAWHHNSSKSWMLHNFARNYLNTHPNGIYVCVNAEGTNDHEFLEMLGVDTRRTVFLQPDSGEQAWDAAIKIAAQAEKAFIGVDSLDACVPMVEIEGDVGDQKYAPAAKMNNKGFRKLIATMKSDLTSQTQRITPVFITQLREAIGVMFGDTKVAVGGKGKKFAAMSIIRLARIKALRTGDEEKGAVKAILKQTYGLEIEANVIKNKGWGEGDKVRYTLYKENHEGFRRGQIDNVTELIPYLLQYKVIQKAGAWITLGADRYNGDADLAEQLRINDNLRDWCITRVKEEHSKRYEKADPQPTPTKEEPQKRGRPPVLRKAK
jgi:recombination protein RecA